jgi:tRNA-dihydrouridine synthase A
MFQALSLAKRITKREYFAIAPMVDTTDRHFRYFMRMLSKNMYVYTEMLNEHAILLSKKRH